MKISKKHYYVYLRYANTKLLQTLFFPPQRSSCYHLAVSYVGVIKDRAGVQLSAESTCLACDSRPRGPTPGPQSKSNKTEVESQTSVLKS